MTSVEGGAPEHDPSRMTLVEHLTELRDRIFKSVLAIAVGALIGLVVGKVGGRNPLLPVLCIAFALFAVIFGELFGDALIISHVYSEQGASLSVSDILFHHFGDLWDVWKHDFGVKRAFYLLCAALVSFGLSKRVSMS